ncbi:MAG TPA: NADPH-dependent FMN reductase [Steroidobacteraceae bacterium]|nr:NADPH-dependent FMN reductase [Steroidobacteraceae bacterium]
MVKILGISGSLRRGSFNAGLLRAAVELAAPGAQIETGTIEGIPLYNNDEETASGVPPAVARLKERVLANQALLLVTPEYNNSIPGVFKNAIDWLSRPPADIPRILAGRPVALIGASPGRFGTINSQTAWLTVLRALRMRPWFGGNLYVSGAASLFDAAGKLTDQPTRERLAEFLQGFAKSVAGS